MSGLLEFLKGKSYSGDFEARPHYSPDGDCVTLYVKDVEAYGKRLDELLTVYKSIDDDELVGCQIKGVQLMLERLGNFGICIEKGEVTIGLLFLHLLVNLNIMH